jgi:CRP/FNR family transcriptional regulator, carbon monoxide oxidation system transcription regulator
MAGHPVGNMKSCLIDALEKDDGSKPILSQFTECSYHKRQLLFIPYHKENLIFLVKRGRLRVYLALMGKEISLAILGPGDVYSTHTRAHVEALEETTILTCPTDAFLSHANQQHPLIAALMGSVGRLMTGAISTIENLYFNCADKRVAVYFYEQAVSFGQEVKEGIYVKIGLTVDNIAKIVGSSRQTVSTLLSSMEKDGIIKKLNRGEYVILDMRELFLLANSCSE